METKRQVRRPTSPRNEQATLPQQRKNMERLTRARAQTHRTLKPGLILAKTNAKQEQRQASSLSFRTDFCCSAVQSTGYDLRASYWHAFNTTYRSDISDIGSMQPLGYFNLLSGSGEAAGQCRGCVHLQAYPIRIIQTMHMQTRSSQPDHITWGKPSSKSKKC